MTDPRFVLKDTIYHKPEHVSLKQANDMLVTFAFTRHPFNRLVSSYHDKMLPGKHGQERRGVSDSLIKLRHRLMLQYRNLNPNNSSELPTPIIFVTESNK